MTERWKIAIDNGLTVGAVFIDFQKVSILFVTTYYHINYMLLEYQDLFTNDSCMSYLSNGSQFTEVNNCKSTTGYVRYGVPQGSPLVPRLYTIYVNDLTDQVDSGDIYLYADDTTVYCIGPSVDITKPNLGANSHVEH